MNEHCQMSWGVRSKSPTNFVKVFTCRQCGDTVESDHHPHRKCRAFVAPVTKEAKDAAQKYLLDVMGDYDFTVPTKAFKQLVDVLATAPCFKGESQTQEVGTDGTG